MSPTRSGRSHAERVLISLVLFTALQLSHSERGARADQVPDLARTLIHSKHEKARIGAAVSLGRLRDPRGLKALVAALRDPSSVVRSVAATSLGHLGDPRALPALRRATKDRDPSVRRRALTAISKIRQAGHRHGHRHARSQQKRRRSHMFDALANYSVAGKERPRFSPRRPELYVVVKSTSDESRGRVRKKLRQRRARYMRALMMRELRHNRSVTLEKSVAEELGVPPYKIDLSIARLDSSARGAFVEVECQIRIAISNERGKMISFLTGGAKVQVPRRTFRRHYEPQLQKEALENAVKSVHQDLITFLRKRPS